MLINSLDREKLRHDFQNAIPFRFFAVDNFLEPGFARQVLDSFPSYEEAKKIGRGFDAVNEKGKIQVTDSSKFSPAIARLNEELASPAFLDFLSYVTEMPELLADNQLSGGGIHETGPRGHLDVHVDFNFIADRQLHRRLNILVYFNPDWKDEWGGNIELWDKDVKVCHHSFSPIFNRCVVFNTNEISFHGVSAVRCPPGMSRKSFAAYYYTRQAPQGWDGESHSTIFRARPDEVLKGKVLMPAEKTRQWISSSLRGIKDKIKGH